MNEKLIKRILKRERRKDKVKHFFHLPVKEMTFEQKIINLKQADHIARQQIYLAVQELLSVVTEYYKKEIDKI